MTHHALARLFALGVAALLIAPERGAAQSAAANPKPAPPSISGRSGVLEGVVTDTDGVVIPSAEVTVAAFGVAVRTDEKGAFRLPTLPAGEHTLRVRRLGYQPGTRSFTVRDGESWQLLVELAPAPQLLSSVEVAARAALGKMAAFERRRHGNVGLFVTREQIVARSAMLLSDVVRTLPGVSVGHGGGDGGRLQLRGMAMGGRPDCGPAYYVDGIYVPGLDIDAIPPGDVQGIELYRGISETPVDFRAMNSPCGVVSIWTRDPEDRR